MIRVLLACTLAAASTLAQAGIITVDASRYAIGTDLSHPSDGVVFSDMRVPDQATQVIGAPFAPMVFAPIHTVECSLCQSPGLNGQPVFGHAPMNGTDDESYFDSNYAKDYEQRAGAQIFQGSYSSLANAFSVSFDAPIDFFSITVQKSAGNFFFASLSESDGATSVVSVIDVTDPANPVPVTDDGPGRAEILKYTYQCSVAACITGFAGGGLGGPGYISSVSYSSVPEPTMLGLFGAAGLLVPFGTRRRRRS